MRDFLEVDGADCAYVLFGLAGTLLTQNALRRIGHAFSVFDDAQVVYGDLDIRSDDGSVWPLALSAFDYERMLEQGYCAHLFAARSSVVTQALAAGASDLYRLFNSILENEGVSSDSVVHLPGSLGVLPMFDRSAASETLAAASLAHLQARGIEAQATTSSRGHLSHGAYRPRY